MNSLVVLLSVMALVSAKPSVVPAGIISYAAPAVAVAPAAVSHQSRIDVKSSPAIVALETPVSRAVIAEPAIVAPAAYAAPLAIPAAVSSQSRVDIKSSPGLISTVAGPVAYSAPIAAPLAYSAPIASPFAYNAPIAAPLAYSAPITTPLGYAPIAAAYASPVFPSAIIPPQAVKAADVDSVAVAEPAEKAEAPELPVAPTETPEVAAARAAHLEAKAFEEAHHNIQKRSVVAAPLISTYAAAPVISRYAVSPVVYPATRLALSTPYLSSAYGIHPY